MKRGKHLARRKVSKRKLTALSIVALFLLIATIGGTIAYLTTEEEPLTNTFTPSSVSCEVTESFNGTIKSNVNVKNTGDTSAYVRVRLVTYRVNDAGDRIGGTAKIPSFTPGTGWEKNGNYYYYTQPVVTQNHTGNLIGSNGITLQSYNDADGGKQVIEVIAEAIQSEPARAVENAWGVIVSNGSLVMGN